MEITLFLEMGVNGVGGRTVETGRRRRMEETELKAGSETVFNGPAWRIDGLVGQRSWEGGWTGLGKNLPLKGILSLPPSARSLTPAF